MASLEEIGGWRPSWAEIADERVDASVAVGVIGAGPNVGVVEELDVATCHGDAGTSTGDWHREPVHCDA